MQSKKKFGARTTILFVSITGLLAPLSLALAEQAEHGVSGPATAEAIKAWHETLKNFPPVAEGCFHASFPSLAWEQEECGAVPAYRSSPPAQADSATSSNVSDDTVGNGYDYSAKTSNLTQSATGSFPSVTGVTKRSRSNTNYTLQLNTNISGSISTNPPNTSPVCASYGYSGCVTWEQFVYSSNYVGGGAQAFIQNWLFIPAGKSCPSGGWTNYSTSSYNGCYKNSASVATTQVPLTGLASVKLAGSASTSGLDTVTFTYGTTAKAITQSGSTLDIGSTWNQSEFNVVGNGGGSAASFNSGSSLTVKLAVNSGSTSAPTCVGPTNGGTTGETNNLNLGSCAVAGGSSPYIQFTESN